MNNDNFVAFIVPGSHLFPCTLYIRSSYALHTLLIRSTQTEGLSALSS